MIGVDLMSRYDPPILINIVPPNRCVCVTTSIDRRIAQELAVREDAVSVLLLGGLYGAAALDRRDIDEPELRIVGAGLPVLAAGY
jgi:hypothetical protein